MATIAAGGRRTFSIRASWPSEGVITGAVEGAGSFSLGFQVAEDGAVLWPAAAAADAAAADGAASPPAREGVVEGGACAPGGSVLRGPTAAAALSATVKAAAAPAVAGQGGEVRPTSITVVEPNQIIVRPDTVYTYLAEPVDIFILANDNIPDPVGTSIKLFNSGSPRGQITLLSLEDDSGEEEDVFTGSDGDLWYWTGAVDGEIPSNLTAPPVVVDNEVYTFLRYSYLTYTPGPFILEGTVQFNYTVGGVLGLVTVVSEWPGLGAARGGAFGARPRRQNAPPPWSRPHPTHLPLPIPSSHPGNPLPHPTLQPPKPQSSGVPATASTPPTITSASGRRKPRLLSCR